MGIGSAAGWFRWGLVQQGVGTGGGGSGSVWGGELVQLRAGGSAGCIGSGGGYML